MKIVLFLGAGFSTAFKLPVMNNFLSFADTSNKLDDNDREFISQLVLDARKANSFLTSSPTNLEDILSFSVMADRLSLKANGEKTINQQTRIILQKIFTQINEVNGFWNKYSELLKSFLSFDLIDTKKYEVSIITTNYDICIECALHGMGISTNPGFEFMQAGISENINLQVQSHLYSSSGVPVLKLHGSVNWFEIQNNSDSFAVEDKIVRVNSISRNPDDSSFPYVLTKNYSSIDAPYIIPPSFLKPDLKGPLTEIWKKAANELKEANLLVFIGYSFPLTDTEMMYFFARSLTENSVLRSILLIDPSAKDIADKINSPLSKFGSHFKDLLTINAKKWETTNLGPYLL